MITQREALLIIRRVNYSASRAGGERFTMKFDAADGVSEPFVVVCNPYARTVRMTTRCDEHLPRTMDGVQLSEVASGATIPRR